MRKLVCLVVLLSIACFAQRPFYPSIGVAASDSAADQACGGNGCQNGTQYLRPSDLAIRVKYNGSWFSISGGGGGSGDVLGGSNLTVVGKGVAVSGASTITQVNNLELPGDRLRLRYFTAPSSGSPLQPSSPIDLTAGYWSSGINDVDARIRHVVISTSQPNSQVEFSIGGVNVAALRRVITGEPAHDFRLFGSTQGSTTFPAIFSLIAPNGTDYADYTYNGSDADIDVTNGGLNLRPFNGNVNIWRLPGQGSARLRIGTAGFGQAFDLWHDGNNAIMQTTTGNIVANSPLEVASAFLHSSTNTNATFLGRLEAGNAASTRPNKSGTSLPASCTLGDTFFKTDASAGNNLHLCTATNVWTQLVSGGSGGNLSGDVTGPMNSTTVVGLQNRSVANVAPSAGQVLTWNATLSHWEPQNPSGGGGGAATHTTQLTDFGVTRSSATLLNIGQNCSSSAPCKLRFGSKVVSVVSGGSVTVSSGTGVARVWVNDSGNIIVGTDGTLAVTCSGCTAVSATQFPENVVIMYSWSANNGAWDLAGGIDYRNYMGTEFLDGGLGITRVVAGGKTTFSVDSAVVATRVAVPANSSSACSVGSYALDASYAYFCVATNTWRRVAISTW